MHKGSRVWLLLWPESQFVFIEETFSFQLQKNIRLGEKKTQNRPGNIEVKFSVYITSLLNLHSENG